MWNVERWTLVAGRYSQAWVRVDTWQEARTLMGAWLEDPTVVEVRITDRNAYEALRVRR